MSTASLTLIMQTMPDSLSEGAQASFARCDMPHFRKIFALWFVAVRVQQHIL